jgi:hydroxyacylglutathione hydrolase
VIDRIVDEHLRANTYLIETGVPDQVVVIDPGLDTDAIKAALGGRRPVAIACTHGHFDHVGSAHQLQEEYGAPLYLHRGDAKVLRSANFLLMACKIDVRITVPTVDELVDDGTTVELGGETLRFIHTPGHTPGSCLIEFRGALFSGDTIYRDKIGMVEFPGEDKELLRRSILGVWDRLDPELRVYPGHGGAGRLGYIKESNQALRSFLALGAGAVS